MANHNVPSIPVSTEASQLGFFKRSFQAGKSIIGLMRLDATERAEMGVLTPDEAHQSELRDFRNPDTGEFEAILPGETHIAERRIALERANPNVYNRDSNNL